MPGKAPREKGKRLERLIVEILQSYGIEAIRVPLSGSATGFKGDVHATLAGETFQVEAKSRARGFKLLYDALGANDALVIKDDRQDPLIVLSLRRFARLVNEGKTQAIEPAQSSHDPNSVFTDLLPNPLSKINRHRPTWWSNPYDDGE